MPKIEIKKKIDKNALITYFKDLILELERGVVVVGENMVVLPDDMKFEIEVKEENKKGQKKRSIEWEVEWKEKSEEGAEEESDESKEFDESEEKYKKKSPGQNLKKSEEPSSDIVESVPSSAVSSPEDN